MIRMGRWGGHHPIRYKEPESAVMKTPCLTLDPNSTHTHVNTNWSRCTPRHTKIRQESFISCAICVEVRCGCGPYCARDQHTDLV